ncbi:uncharacterized protein [Mytilus edulis]|uniref:uncharacterized protein n=1 Tax=Mytilus edulis TaxID=6550 RepID=UPI0039EEAA11
MSKQPVIFFTHGAGPCFYLDASKEKWCKGIDKHSNCAKSFKDLTKNANFKEPPRAILVLSAHWDENICTVQTNNKPELYYDYSGFPPEAYKLTWNVPGDVTMAKNVKVLLESKGIQCMENNKRGLDHGVFVPLKLAFPKADVPVFQVSLLRSMNLEDNMKIGEALSELSKDGILIVGSGSATHTGLFDNKPADWALQFQEWIQDVVTNPDYSPEQRKSKLVESESQSFLRSAHSRLDHFLPIPMACAAAGYKAGKILYSEFKGSMLMEHYLF